MVYNRKTVFCLADLEIG